MPGTSQLGAKNKRRLELDEFGDDDADIIDVTPAKRSRPNSRSVPHIVNNFFKKIGQWFKKTGQANTHLFGVPLESNSAAEAIAHGGQYLDEASNDKFMPRHNLIGNGNHSTKVNYPQLHGGGGAKPNLLPEATQRPPLVQGVLVNGDSFYEERASAANQHNPSQRNIARQNSANSANTNPSAAFAASSKSNMHSFTSSTNDPSLKMSQRVEDGSKQRNHSGSSGPLDGSEPGENAVSDILQRSYTEEAAKHHNARARPTVYDKSFASTAESPPITAGHWTTRKRNPSSKQSFDLDEKERYKTLLQQYALRGPLMSPKTISLSRASTNPGAMSSALALSLPSNKLFSTETRSPLSSDATTSAESHHDSTTYYSFSEGKSMTSQFTSPKGKSQTRTTRSTTAAKRIPVQYDSTKPSETMLRCDYLAKRMQELKEKTMSRRMADRTQLKTEEMKLEQWEKLRAAEDEHLERMVQQRLQLSAKVILEDLPDQEEEEDEFPELSDEAELAISKAWQRGPNNILSTAFKLKITRSDLATLCNQQWLNDEIVNFYFNLIQERSGADDLPSVWVFNTFFYPKIMKEGHKGVRRWTKQVDLFTKDLVLVPIHLGMHWCLALISLRDKMIQYFDSMGGRNEPCLEALRRYIEDESMDKKKQRLDTSDWLLECVRDIPQQMNGSDCGVFSCKYAEYLSRDVPFTFSQEHMPYFRRRMVYEILTKKLL